MACASHAIQRMKRAEVPGNRRRFQAIRRIARIDPRADFNAVASWVGCR
jgi:hypothetical protein